MLTDKELANCLHTHYDLLQAVKDVIFELGHLPLPSLASLQEAIAKAEGRRDYVLHKETSNGK